MTLTRLAHSITLAWGWRRALIAFAAGATTVLALPPLNIWPAPFLTFPVLVWLVDGAASGRLGGMLAAAVIGWWFGFGYFLAGLYWIGDAFLVDAKTFGWLLPFAVTLLPAGLALFTAFGLALARLIWTRGAMRVLALAIGLTVAEWLRGTLVHRISLERLRLRTRDAAAAGAGRGAGRALGPDVPGGGGLRQCGRARRRSHPTPGVPGWRRH